MGTILPADAGYADYQNFPPFFSSVILSLHTPAVTFMVALCLLPAAESLCPALEHHDEPVEQDYVMMPPETLAFVVSGAAANFPNRRFFGTADADAALMRAYNLRRWDQFRTAALTTTSTSFALRHGDKENQPERAVLLKPSDDDHS